MKTAKYVLTIEYGTKDACGNPIPTKTAGELRNILQNGIDTAESITVDEIQGEGDIPKIEIPQNTKVNDVNSRVEKAISAVLTDPRFEKFGFSDRIKVNHGSAREEWDEVWVLNAQAEEIARRFKAKGYHAHYCFSNYGRAFNLTITKYPTNQDI